MTHLIVITGTNDNNSYLVPKPGVRLNLADLVENLPLGSSLGAIAGINNHGDMILVTTSSCWSVSARQGRSRSRRPTGRPSLPRKVRDTVFLRQSQPRCFDTYRH